MRTDSIACDVSPKHLSETLVSGSKGDDVALVGSSVVLLAGEGSERDTEGSPDATSNDFCPRAVVWGGMIKEDCEVDAESNR